ncbi:hypothetical protein D3C81_2270030 [compost metagenome]
MAPSVSTWALMPMVRVGSSPGTVRITPPFSFQLKGTPSAAASSATSFMTCAVKPLGLGVSSSFFRTDKIYASLG